MFKLNWSFFDPSWMVQIFEFVWTLRSSVWIVFNNFLFIDATDRSKISIDQKRLFSHYAYTPFHFSRALPLSYKYFKIIFSTNLLSKELSFFLGLYLQNKFFKHATLKIFVKPSQIQKNIECIEKGSLSGRRGGLW